MTHLSRLCLDPRSRQVQRDLADCHALHRRMMDAFPAVGGADVRRQLGVLYRVDLDRSTGQMTLLVQSSNVPDWSHLPTAYLTRPPHTKSVDATYGCLRAGSRCRFRLRANPTKRVHAKNTEQDEKWRGKRIDLRDPEDRERWLKRKAEQSGFRLLEVFNYPDVVAAVVTAESRSIGFDPVDGRAHRMTFGAAVFDGRLEVTDADRFREALEHGIGSGKAFGFGLLSIAPAG